MSISMYRAYISMVIVFRTYGCTSFLSSFNNVSVMFVNREKKSYRPTPVWKSNFVCYNLCDEHSSKSTCMVVVQYKNNSVVCGRCLPGKFHQVHSASAAGSIRRVTFMSCAQNVKIICFSVRTYFRSFNAETCLLEVALNRILGAYR